MPGGRPTDMDRTVSHDADGNPVTVAAQILADLRIGNYLETAARRAGISQHTVKDWVSVGARAAKDLNDGRRQDDDISPHERHCLDFSTAVDRAISESETRLIAELEVASRQGRQTVTVTRKVLADGSVEETTRTTTEGPDLATIRWRLERKFPDKWGRQVVEVTGPEGGPIEVTVAERAASIAEELARFQAQQPDPATNGH